LPEVKIPPPIDIRIGCAGWSVPKLHAKHFPAQGSHLERYAGRFSAVEINSSFYRPHRPATYARWAASVPADFRFAVKVPREISHQRRLADTADVLDRFLAEAGALGDKLGPLLVQLPPSLTFTPALVRKFFAALRKQFAGTVACEPRHRSWFQAAADRLLAEFQVARVAADPAVVPAAAEPGGWDGLVYHRLHGSPQMYYSPYPADYLATLAGRLTQEAGAAPVWCTFDNTALGHATANALDLQERLRTNSPR
jgi:uncharacterized protein YecE (DUF72 family)